MIWFTKRFEHHTDYAPDLDWLCKIQELLNSQRRCDSQDLAMGKVAGEGCVDIFIGLPRPEFAALFKGYAPVQCDLPDMTPLLGDESVFPNYISVREVGGDGIWQRVKAR